MNVFNKRIPLTHAKLMRYEPQGILLDGRRNL